MVDSIMIENNTRTKNNRLNDVDPLARLANNNNNNIIVIDVNNCNKKLGNIKQSKIVIDSLLCFINNFRNVSNIAKLIDLYFTEQVQRCAKRKLLDYAVAAGLYSDNIEPYTNLNISYWKTKLDNNNCSNNECKDNIADILDNLDNHHSNYEKNISVDILSLFDLLSTAGCLPTFVASDLTVLPLVLLQGKYLESKFTNDNYNNNSNNDEIFNEIRQIRFYLQSIVPATDLLNENVENIYNSLKHQAATDQRFDYFILFFFFNI